MPLLSYGHEGAQILLAYIMLVLSMFEDLN